MSEHIDPSASSAPDSDFNELLEGISTPAPKARPGRQGLPAEYRMRADAHYVEELATRQKDSPSVRAAAPQPPVSMPAALRDLGQEFEGLASCFNLMDAAARPLRERVGLSLAKIGVQRSIRYAQQLRILLEEPAHFSASSAWMRRFATHLKMRKRSFGSRRPRWRWTCPPRRWWSAPMRLSLQTALRACAGQPSR